MGEIYAELWVGIRKTFEMNEKKIMQKWNALVAEYQSNGIDINVDSPSFSTTNKNPSSEICVGLGSGAKTEEPNYDAMYSLLGKFVQFLYEEILFNGPLEMRLERTGGSG